MPPRLSGDYSEPFDADDLQTSAENKVHLLRPRTKRSTIELATRYHRRAAGC
jgi:hypothetical protein